MSKPVLILDAFGVLYEPADDVEELLIPFVREHGGNTDAEYIKSEYRRASLGEMSSAELWNRLGLSLNIEDDYLSLIPLTAGVHGLLDTIPPIIDSLWCLSNDLSEWSRKLRVKHEIAGSFAGFVISGDVKIRKPDAGIYNALLKRIGRSAQDCIFVDDRVKNLDAAKALGFQTGLFGTHETSTVHPSVASFTELTQWLFSASR